MKGALLVIIIMVACFSAHAQDDKQDAKGLDMVSDTVAAVFNKANALLSGNLEVTMSKEEDRARSAQEYTTNALGQKVPKSSAIKAGGVLHNDQPL